MQGAIPERKIPLKENNKPAKRVDIGGQAVLEGVMMRSPEYIALAVRRPDGSVADLYLTGPTNIVCKGEITDESLAL